MKTKFCSDLLNLWNLALDINASFERKNPYLNGSKKIYDKIFYGTNPPVFMSESTVKYIPLFSKKENKQINYIVKEIYQIFDNNL